MGARSAIQWTDHTFNPWIGCTRVSPGCDHCYAERLAGRFKVAWGAHAERRRAAESTWRQPLAWNRKAARDGVRRRVFCASLADVFDNQVPERWRGDLWRLIAATPHLDWLLLTKRPKNIARMLPYPQLPFQREWPWPNVWLGTTVENQAEAERRIPHLLSVPAAVHFLSCEPLLGAIDIRRWLEPAEIAGMVGNCIDVSPAVSWVICGGESGPGARAMHPDWARLLRDQCAAVGVAFHFKQWGEWVPVYDRDRDDPDWRRCDTVARETPRGRWMNLGGGHGFHNERVVRMDRVGKARAGRLLDSREHNDVPVLREVV